MNENIAGLLALLSSDKVPNEKKVVLLNSYINMKALLIARMKMQELGSVLSVELTTLRNSYEALLISQEANEAYHLTTAINEFMD